MTARVGAALLLLASLFGPAGGSPLPPPRPAEPDPAPAATPAPPQPSQAPQVPQPPERPGAGAHPGACLARLQAAGHRAEPGVPEAQPLPGCTIEEPVRLLAVATGGPDRAVALTDRPLIACALAEPLATWIGRVVAPVLAARQGSGLAALRTGQGQECRTRNRQPGEKLSAHARGNALDLASFELANGRTLAVAAMPQAGTAPDAAPEPGATLQAVRMSACGWFTTVLGPGSDAFHADHLHLDVEPHGAGGSYRICQ